MGPIRRPRSRSNGPPSLFERGGGGRRKEAKDDDSVRGSFSENVEEDAAFSKEGKVDRGDEDAEAEYAENESLMHNPAMAMEMADLSAKNYGDVQEMEMGTQQVERVVLDMGSQAAMAFATTGSQATMAAADAAAKDCGEIQAVCSPPHELIRKENVGHLQDAAVTHLQQHISPLAEGNNGAAGSSAASTDSGSGLLKSADSMEGENTKEDEEQGGVFQNPKTLAQNGRKEGQRTRKSWQEACSRKDC